MSADLALTNSMIEKAKAAYAANAANRFSDLHHYDELIHFNGSSVAVRTDHLPEVVAFVYELAAVVAAETELDFARAYYKLTYSLFKQKTYIERFGKKVPEYNVSL